MPINYGELYQDIKSDFADALEQRPDMRAVYSVIAAGKGTHTDTHKLAQVISDQAGASILHYMTPGVIPAGSLDIELAEQTIAPITRDADGLITTAAGEVQTALNSRARIGIKPIIPAIDEPRLARLMVTITTGGSIIENPDILTAPLENFLLAAVDEFIKENADFHARAGLRPRIVRKATGDCCKWCAALAGTYDYPDKTPSDVFRRHKNCHCVVDYDPADTMGLVQNVWSKRWHDPNEQAKIEARKNFNPGAVIQYGVTGRNRGAGRA